MPDSAFRWHRIEPRARKLPVNENLEARVFDPLWFLARQWQFGEFHGEDAASPAYVELKGHLYPISGWERWSQGVGAADKHEYSVDLGPLEAFTTSEPFPADWSTRVELGQRFEAILTESLNERASEIIEELRKIYPIPSTDNEAVTQGDRATLDFLRVCGGRAIDGVELLKESSENGSTVLSQLAIDADLEIAELVRNALGQLQQWVATTFGVLPDSTQHFLGRNDPLSWTPERLEYGFKVFAHTSENKGQVDGAQLREFRAHPDRDGTLDWFTFDQTKGEVEQPEPNEFESEEVTERVFPTFVSIPGMPNKRWWQFENRRLNFPALEPNLNELAKLILIDFVLVQSNDWFVVPFAQKVGTLFQVDYLKVFDVFGRASNIERAEHLDARLNSNAKSPSDRWSMFSLTVEGEDEELADVFIMPPDASATVMTGAPVEEVRFIRDEMANMVWAIESITENGLAAPWSGRDRFRDDETSIPNRTTQLDASLIYTIQTSVPRHWIPFLPVQISEQRAIALERGAMLNIESSDQEGGLIHPHGRILEPTRLDAPIHDWEGMKVYRVFEEEVPRAGLQVSRLVFRTRWIDGSTHMWMGRRKRVGRGEGSSRLRFDAVLPTEEVSK